MRPGSSSFCYRALPASYRRNRFRVGSVSCPTAVIPRYPPRTCPPTPSTAQRASRRRTWGPQVLEPVAARTFQDALGKPCAALLTSQGDLPWSILPLGPPHHPKPTVRIRSLERHHLSHPIRAIAAQHSPYPKHPSLKTETMPEAQLHNRSGRERCPIAQVCTRGRPSPHICCRTPSVTGTASCHWTRTNEVLSEFALVVKPGRRSRLMPFSSLEVSRADGWDGTEEGRHISQITFLLGADGRLLQRPSAGVQ